MICSDSGFRDKSLYSGNRNRASVYRANRLLEPFRLKRKRSYLFPLINSSLIRANTPLIRAVRRAAVIMLQTKQPKMK